MSNPDLGNGKWVPVDIKPGDKSLVGRIVSWDNDCDELKVLFVGERTVTCRNIRNGEEFGWLFGDKWFLWEPEQEKPEPREIERMGNNYMLGSANRGLANKINELVDAINELRSGDYGSKGK